MIGRTVDNRLARGRLRTFVIKKQEAGRIYDMNLEAWVREMARIALERKQTWKRKI